MKMKKYKEFRMTLLLLVIALVMAGISLYCGMIGQRSRLIIGLMIAAMMLILALTRYNLTLEDTCMLIYEWKIIAMLPVIIDYQDIKAVEALGSHKVKITHKVISYVYVFQAADFVEQYRLIRASEG